MSCLSGLPEIKRAKLAINFLKINYLCTCLCIIRFNEKDSRHFPCVVAISS